MDILIPILLFAALIFYLSNNNSNTKMCKMDFNFLNKFKVHIETEYQEKKN